MKEKQKTKIKLILKIIVSIALIYYIIQRIGLEEIYSQVREVELIYFAFVIFIFIFNIMISAKKWQILLKAKGESRKFLQVWKFYYIGNFFNMFLPTNVGGDVVKAHKMSKISKTSIEAYSSVFMERFTGLIAIIALATVSTTLFFEHIGREIVLIIYGLFLPLIVVSFLLLSSDRFIRWAKKLSEFVFRKIDPFSIKKRSIKMLKSINLYMKKRRTIGSALLISFIYHSLLIISNYILGIAVGIDISMYYFFIFIPITHIILFLPISIRGLGVREVIYVYFFTQVGATGAQAFSLSILVQIMGVISSLIGGFVYLSSKLKKMKSMSE